MQQSIIVEASESCLAERDYILGVILGEYLGLAFQVVPSDKAGFRIRLDGAQGEILLPSVLLSMTSELWLTKASLPKQPLFVWDSRALGIPVNLITHNIPCIYGDEGFAFSLSKTRIVLPVDIFGSAFFMLTRYEEAVVSDRDKRNRFPAEASCGYKSGYLDRPVVDEYAEILWVCIKQLWPGLNRKQPQPQIFITCDLDHPYVVACNTTAGAIRHIAGDVLKRHSFVQMFDSFNNIWLRRTKHDYSKDAYLKNTIWIMDVNEKQNNRVAFFFISKPLRSCFVNSYSMDESIVRAIMRSIYQRGHEIGLHGSYNSYNDGTRLQSQVNELRRVMDAENIQQQELGGRQHCLRWETPTTASLLERAGLSYDSTLGYPSVSGFRCGTSREYSMYDLRERTKLKLRQRPLVVMECSVIEKSYMGLGYSDKALQLMLYYKKVCHQFGGCFTLLWHNSYLMMPKDKEFYEELIKC